MCGQQAILAKKRFEQEQDREKEDQKQKILEMYGAEKFQKPVDARLRLGQTEAYVSTKMTHSHTKGHMGLGKVKLPSLGHAHYQAGCALMWCLQVEYSRDGRMIKGAPKAVVRSKYQVRPSAFGLAYLPCPSAAVLVPVEWRLMLLRGPCRRMWRSTTTRVCGAPSTTGAPAGGATSAATPRCATRTAWAQTGSATTTEATSSSVSTRAAHSLTCTSTWGSWSPARPSSHGSEGSLLSAPGSHEHLPSH